MSLKKQAVKPVNGLLRPLNVQLVRGRSADPAIADFISARKTISAARKTGLSVGDYIDATYAKPGATAETVAAMLELGELHGPGATVCEIGPGSGRYSEHVIKALQPARYEIYETAADWLAYLAGLQLFLIHDSDGHTLSKTTTASMDLVHAHKVFVYLEFGATVGYLAEMARVVRPGGTVAFDIVTEACLDDTTVLQWAAAGGTIFRPIPRNWAIDFMQRRGCSLRGTHLSPLPDGTTELFVFRRD